MQETDEREIARAALVALYQISPQAFPKISVEQLIKTVMDKGTSLPLNLRADSFLDHKTFIAALEATAEVLSSSDLVKLSEKHPDDGAFASELQLSFGLGILPFWAAFSRGDIPELRRRLNTSARYSGR